MTTEASGEWMGSPCPINPDNYWINDATGERIKAESPKHTVCPQRIIKEAIRLLELVWALQDETEEQNIIYNLEELKGLAKALPTNMTY